MHFPDSDLCEFHFQILSEWARDLASKPPSLLNRTFNHAFGQHMVGNPLLFFAAKIWLLNLFTLLNALLILSRFHPESLNFGKPLLILMGQVHLFQALDILMTLRSYSSLVKDNSCHLFCFCFHQSSLVALFKCVLGS